MSRKTLFIVLGLVALIAAGGIAWINSVGNIGGFLAPIAMGRLMLQSGGDGFALAGLAAVLLLASGLALGLPRWSSPQTTLG